MPGGSFGLGEADELLLPREHVVQALGLAGEVLLVVGIGDELFLPLVQG